MPAGTNETFAKAHFPHAALIEYASNRAIFGDLASGRADVMVTDGAEVDLQAHRHPDVLCPADVPQAFDHFEKAYWMTRDPALQAAVDGAVEKHLDAGDYSRAWPSDPGGHGWVALPASPAGRRQAPHQPAGYAVRLEAVKQEAESRAATGRVVRAMVFGGNRAGEEVGWTGSPIREAPARSCILACRGRPGGGQGIRVEVCVMAGFDLVWPGFGPAPHDLCAGPSKVVGWPAQVRP